MLLEDEVTELAPANDGQVVLADAADVVELFVSAPYLGLASRSTR